MADTTYQVFLTDPDQSARRAELTAFFGPRPEKFLAIYDGMVEVANRPTGTRPKFKFFEGFCWPAFFLGPIWMFYRKMWVYGSIVLAVFFIFSFLPIPRGAGIGLGVAIAAAGARLYVTHAINTITKLRNRPAELATAGGVSPMAGWSVGIAYLLIVGYFTWRIVVSEAGPQGSSHPPSLSEPR